MSVMHRGPLVLVAATIGILLPACRFVAAAEREPNKRTPAATAPNTPGPAPTATTLAPANPRGNRRPQANPAMYAGPMTVGLVKAIEAEKSLEVEVKRRGGRTELVTFDIVPKKTKIELTRDTQAIAVGMTVSVWTDRDQPKAAVRIVAGTAGAAQPTMPRPNNARPNARPNPNAQPGAMMNAPPTQLARIEPVAPVVPTYPKREPVAGLAPLDVARQIDKLIDTELAAAGIKASPRTDDAEFMRRVYLDITGVIPPADKVAAFLDDRNSDKRAKLVGDLLESPAYGEHFADLWCDRIAVKDMPIYREPFIAWISAGFNQGRGWDEIVFDLLTAGGNFNFITRGKRLASTDPRALFLLLNTEEGMGKGPNPAWLTAESGRLFLGVQLQCAECHNHPFTESWKQTDFWGLAAFYGGIRVERNQTTPASWVETPTAAGTPVSMVIPPTALKSVGTTVPARLLGDERDFVPGETAVLRQTVARWITSPKNPYFAQAAVNRVWSDFFGRGLVHPIDDMRPDNPATHPEVLALLADEFKKSRFDLKHLIRCLCLSEAYQRSAAPLPENESDQEKYSRMSVKILGPGVLYDCLTQATGWQTLNVGLPLNKTKLTVQSTFTPREVFVDFFRSQQGQEADPQEYLHGIPQSLKLMNSAQLNAVPPIVQQLVAAKLAREQVVEQMYLAAYARRPTPAEATATAAYLARRSDGDLEQGYAAVMWALVNSAEFVSNH